MPAVFESSIKVPDGIDKDLFEELQALERLIEKNDTKEDWGEFTGTVLKTIEARHDSFSRGGASTASESTCETSDECDLHSKATCETSCETTTSCNLHTFVKASESNSVVVKADRTIAELFPEATVTFADISGFTAWSSIREADQVFTLLEAIFQAFDEIASRLGVFKVETVGDCYVAVCGLPDPNPNHAIVMAQFARECLNRFNHVIRELEMKLGPDTADLAVRVGINSGPVTAGVIRGERARLQLFGDTVNTAARIESTGMRDRIHLSEITASLIREAGHESWISQRKDIVSAKGKGRMTTFWLNQSRGQVSPSNVLRELQSQREGAFQRCIDWNSELLMQLLKNLVAHRNALRGRNNKSTIIPKVDANLKAQASQVGRGMLVVDEVADIIQLPDFDKRAAAANPEAVVLSPNVAKQCRAYVALIASMYRNNAFHNFEHATHVTMSVHKLLSRIVRPKHLDDHADEQIKSDHTYGITSDPLTQFSVVLSALIHDVDHRGVPNNLLSQEDQCLAKAYQNKSVAEQNSVEVAWDVLLMDQLADFRACIFENDVELHRFRQLLVNSVIATDIFDKEQSSLRKNRWAQAFADDATANPLEDPTVAKNRKATIVIEHLIQASDVSHTMQHWHVYQKWNERLFQEMYEAYLDKRSDKDPSLGWYKGEIWFFDNYVIPLAKKLKNCGVFGVSSDEYLNYARTNRNEWVIKGEQIVEKLKEKYGRAEP